MGRVSHRYGFTRGASKTGSAGTGTVPDLVYPAKTAYLYYSVTGFEGYFKVQSYILNMNDMFLTCLTAVYLQIKKNQL